MFSTYICIQAYIYMAAYDHTYSYIYHFGAREVHETSSQRIHMHEASAHYTKLTQLWCSATQIPCKGL